MCFTTVLFSSMYVVANSKVYVSSMNDVVLHEGKKNQRVYKVLGVICKPSHYLKIRLQPSFL